MRGGDSETTTAYRTCPLCEATCGLEITLRGDQVERVRGDKDDVFSHGHICPKGAALAELHNDPDRLRRPLVRQGGQWRETDWPEALALVDKGLNQVWSRHGRDALAVYLGNPCVHTMAGVVYMRPLLKALATRSIYSASTVDQMPRHVACGHVFGHVFNMPVPDVDRAMHLVIVGGNPVVSNGSMCTAPGFRGRLAALKDRGGRLVVIDPRRSETAALAHEHLFVRPGADAALLAAMAHTLLEEGLADLGRLAEFTNGVDELRQAMARFSPEAVAGFCGVAAADIRRQARDLAAAPSAAVYVRMGGSTQEFGALCNWLGDALNVLTGNLDRPGGSMFPAPAHTRASRKPGGRGWSMGRWSSRVAGLPEVAGELPVAALAQEMDTPGQGQVRALLTIAGNPVLSTPNQARLEAALAGLEFMVAIDFYRNETTRHAHVILPPAGPLETGHYDFSLYNLAVHNVANYSPPVLPPSPDGLDKWEIMLRLALIAQGQGPDADHLAADDALVTGMVSAWADEQTTQAVMAGLGGRKGPERLLDLMLRTGRHGDMFGQKPGGLSLDKLLARPHGVDLGPLEPALPAQLKTASGRVELAPPPLVADLDRLWAAMERPRDEGPVLVGRRHLRSCNTWLHNLPSLVKGRPRCVLLVHPDDAARLGLADGGRAVLTTRVGSVTAPVRVSDEMMPGVVSLPHGWGHQGEGLGLAVASANPGVNSNILADENLLDPQSGTSVLNGLAVSVAPAREG